MLYNSFEHGYQDARRGLEARSACNEYVEGYKRAVNQIREDKSLTFWTAGLLFLILGAVFCVVLAESVPGGPV